MIRTLQCYESSPHREQAIPVWQILTTPVENLRNRAERIAPQLAHSPGIAAATAIETRSPIAAALLADDGWPSYAIALSPADGDIQSLYRRLSNAIQPVMGRIEDDRLVLDLRTVFPRQDTELVEALAGAPPAETSEQRAAVDQSPAN